jgi:hypothetical protein
MLSNKEFHGSKVAKALAPSDRWTTQLPVTTKTRHPLAQTCPKFAKMIVLMSNSSTIIQTAKE